MMKRILVTAAVLVTTGCSFGMKQLPEGWDGTSEPECSSSPAPLVGDVIMTGIGTGVMLGGIDAESDSVVIAGVIIALPFALAGIVGEGSLRDCREAKATWRIGGAIGRASRDRSDSDDDRERRRRAPDRSASSENDPSKARTFWCAQNICVTRRSSCGDGCMRRMTAWCAGGASGFVCSETRSACLAARDDARDRSMGECIERSAELAHLPDEKPAEPLLRPAPEPVRRGFFCSRSAATPTVGFCTREKVDCQRARDTVIAAIADLDECRLVETAFCHVSMETERCGPTVETCEVRAKSALGVDVPCKESQ